MADLTDKYNQQLEVSMRQEKTIVNLQARIDALEKAVVRYFRTIGQYTPSVEWAPALALEMLADSLEKEKKNQIERERIKTIVKEVLAERRKK